MTATVLIPTVGGRDAMLAQARMAYAHEGHGVHAITGTTWGGGCNALTAAHLDADYLLFACDDKLPLEGWFDAARQMLDAGIIPQSQNLTVQGYPVHEYYDDLPHGAKADWTRDFLLTPAIYEKVGPMLDTTWFTDFDYSQRLVAAGYPMQACAGFTFTHLDAPREWATDQVLDRERRVYENRRV